MTDKASYVLNQSMLSRELTGAKKGVDVLNKHCEYVIKFGKLD